MARLYANENFPLPVIEELRGLGHDVLTSLDEGRSGQAVPDEEVLAFSVAEGRALPTLNRRHFLKLVQQRPEHAGLIACTFNPDFQRQAGAIHAAMGGQSSLAREIIRINRPR